MKVLNNLDLAKNQLLNPVVQNLASAPATPTEGQIYHNTADHNLYLWNGTAWINLGQIYVHPNHTGDVTSTGDGVTAIAAGVIVDADVNAAANVTGTKIAAATTTVRGTVELATDGEVAASLAVQSNDSRLSNSRPPTGTAGGDLTGTYPNPTVTTDAITNAKLANMAAYTLKGNNTASSADPADLTASQVKTLLAIVPGDVSGFDTQVRVSRLDQMALPQGGLSMNNFGIRYLQDPIDDDAAATKRYVDNVLQGIDAHQSVVAASTGNMALTGSGSSLDSVALTEGDRVLLKDQTAPAANGLYTYSAATGGRFTRASDADSWDELRSAFVWVEKGATNADSGWLCTVDSGGTLETTAVTWVQFSGAGQITAGNGLSKTGNTLDVNVDSSSIEINADTLRVKALGITNAMLAGSVDLTTKVTGQLPVANGGTAASTAVAARTNLGAVGKYAANCTANASQTITAATHGLGAGQDKIVQIFTVASTYDLVNADVQINASTGDVTIVFATAPTAGQYRIVIMG